MNTKDSSSLMDEGEIRAALSVFRIDRDAFGHGVRKRVEQARVRPAGGDNANLKGRDRLLRIAGSVLPVNLLGANAAAPSTSLAAVGGFQKAVAFLALPAISFLMIFVTIGSGIRIRNAQKTQALPEADLSQIEKSVRGWWRRYGWIAGIVFALTLASPFWGWTTPLIILFLVSAVGTASMVATLGKAGLVDRNVIGGYCIAMFGILGQVSGGFSNSNHTQLLDPHLVTVTFFAGAALLILLVDPWKSLPRGDIRKRSGMGIVYRVLCFTVLFCAAAFFGQSLWRPVGTPALVQYAESFKPNLVGQWREWQATARWLQDAGIEYDQSAVQARWQEAVDRDASYRTTLFNQATSTGLALPSEVAESEDYKLTVQTLFLHDSAGRRMFGVEHVQYVFAKLIDRDLLDDELRDHLARRLMATWRALRNEPMQRSLDAAAAITELLSMIDRPIAMEERKVDVDRWLAEYQFKLQRPFSRLGGFKSFPAAMDSDLLSTECAVRLMEHYGTFSSVDVLALRAFLRPSSIDRQLIARSCVRVSTLQRLDQIPGIPRPSLWDYLRLNQSLWFAMMLVGLCVYATLGSPQLLPESSDSE